MIFAVKSSYDSDSSSSAVAASEKVLVPGVHCDGSSSSTDQLEVADTVSTDTQVCKCRCRIHVYLALSYQINSLRPIYTLDFRCLVRPLVSSVYGQFYSTLTDNQCTLTLVLL